MRHFKSIAPVSEPEEIIETSWGDYAPGELDMNGYCMNLECRQPGNRWYGFCLRCEEV
jgi:hypothetical protein